MILEERSIKIDGKTIEAVSLSLGGKNLIVLKGSRGYVMCGYLDMASAERFGDVAVKITGVSTIDDALGARAAACSAAAKKIGISERQTVQDVLKAIA